MKATILRHTSIFGLVLLLGSLSTAQQTVTGTPPFGSFGGGPFDVINLGNLNVHFSVPVLKRAGRGTSFFYNLSYDSSIWTPVTSGGVTSWQPTGGWGWQAQTDAVTGYVPSPITSQGSCKFFNGRTWQTEFYTKSSYPGFVDPLGTYHHVLGLLVIAGAPDCADTGSITKTADDGSGYTVTVPDGIISSRGGKVWNVPVGNRSGAAKVTDPNGNQITTSDGKIFYDTLSASLPVLTISGTNPVSYTYTPPAGGTASYQVHYSSYNIKTAFGCSGVSEYATNGVSLVSSIGLPDGSAYHLTYEDTPGFSGYKTGRLASLTLPTGGVISYSYTGTNHGINCTDGSTQGMSRDFDSGTWTYDRSGSNPNYTTTVTDPPGNTTALSFYAVAQSSTYGYYETSRVVKNPTGGYLETITTCYNASCNNNPSLPVTQLNIYKYVDGTNATLKSQTALQYGATTGLLNYRYDYTWNGSAWVEAQETATTYASLGNGIANRPSLIRVFDGGGNLKAETSFAYDEYALQTTSSTPNHVSVSGARGNVTTVNRYVNGSTYLTSHSHYYDTGTPYQAQDVNGATTTYTYGSGSCGNSFVTGIAEAISGLSKSMTWNCTGGVMASATDENGSVTSFDYATDTHFWRPDYFQDALGNQTNYSYPSTTQSESVLDVGSSSAVDILNTIDGYGRPYLMQRRQAPSSSTYDSVEQHHYQGLPNWTSVSYAAGAGAFAPNGTPATGFTYDGLGRLTKTIYGGGTGSVVNLNYPNLFDTYQSIGPAPSGEGTKDKQLEYDAIGRLTSVCEITSGTGSGTCGQKNSVTGYWTKYTYDSPTNSMQVSQNAQGTAQPRSYQYDFLGRLTSETNPESGTTTYIYDQDTRTHGCPGSFPGDLVARVDNAGVQTCHTYDTLHRVTSITYAAAVTVSPTKCFVYDSATVNGLAMSYAKGRLAEAYTYAAFSCPATPVQSSVVTDLGFGYSRRGEVLTELEKTPHSGGYFNVCAAYWPHGALKSLNCLASMPYVIYGSTDGTNSSGLDGEGRVNYVWSQSGQIPITGVNYVTSGTTQPIGAITQVSFGSGDSDTFSWNVATGKLNQYVFNVGAQSVTGNLTWNANGTLGGLQITDQVNPSDTQTCAYGYDDLVRVSSVNCGASIWAQNFSYDAFGNITKNVPSGSTGISFLPTYSSATNQFSSIPGVTTTYDANGNLTADGSHTYAWDVDGKAITIDAVNVTYDAMGRMAELAKNSSNIQVVYGPDGKKLALMNTTATLVKGYIRLPGGSTAIYKPGMLPAYYRHGDWLGSSRLATTPTQTMYSSVAYAPFGEPYAQAGTTDLSFTEQDQDTVDGLYDFLARRYNPTHGRWVSPDPSGLSAVKMTNPQSWNRYAYVLNNPLRLVDSLGLYDDTCGDDGSCDGGGGGGGDGGGGDGSGDGSGAGDGSGDNSGDNGSVDDGNDPNNSSDTNDLIDQAESQRGQLLLDILGNSTCAAMFGGAGNAVRALIATNYTTTESFTPANADGQEALGNAQQYLSSDPTADAFTQSFNLGDGTPSATTYQVFTFLQPAFGQLPQLAQQAVLLHELEHGVGYGPEIDQNYDTELNKVQQDCPQEQVPTETSQIDGSIPQ